MYELVAELRLGNGESGSRKLRISRISIFTSSYWSYRATHQLGANWASSSCVEHLEPRPAKVRLNALEVGVDVRRFRCWESADGDEFESMHRLDSVQKHSALTVVHISCEKTSIVRLGQNFSYIPCFQLKSRPSCTITSKIYFY